MEMNMRTNIRLSLLAGLLLLSASLLRAQTAPDISGHWEGRLEGPAERAFEVDFVKAAGGYTGTIGIPAENLKGLPITKVTLNGKAIYFRAREDQPFNGYVSEDGKLMTGDMSLEGFSIPVSLTRTGDPRIEPAAKSPAIAKELEGAWNGTISGLRLVLRLANQPDGTSTGRVVNLDQGNLEIPISAITQAESGVTFDLKAIHASYSGKLNESGTELVGTYSEGSRSAPLTFTRRP